MKRLGASIILVGNLGISICAPSNDDRERSKKVLNVAERLKKAYPSSTRNENLRFLKETKDGLQIYTPSYKSSFNLPNCRVVTCEIHSPLDEVESLWRSQDIRKDWDNRNYQNSQIIQNPSENSQTIFLLGKPSSFFLPPRDFTFTMDALPAGIVGVNDYRALVFVCMNNDDKTLKSKYAVHSRMNALLILEPKTAERTQLTYIVEVDDGGWFHPWFIDFTADSYISTISYFKTELEKSEELEERQLSVEDAAKLRFERHRQHSIKKAQSTTIVDDVTTTKEDLLITINLLEKRIQDLKKTEKSEGISLSDLRSRVERDLRKAKDRLKDL